MNSIELSVPGKVFLGGEYLALSGGTTLLAGIEPRFRMYVEESNLEEKNPFHENSPAGKLWLKYQKQLAGYQTRFVDAFQGQGGFGGSTAEFILLYAFLNLKKSKSPDAQTDIDVHSLLNEYRTLSATNGFTPSGSDLIAQVRGGITLFSREQGKIQNYAWLFTDLGFFVAKTNTKLKTHEHLATLKKFDHTALSLAMSDVQNSLETYQSENFISALNSFALQLEKLGFVCQETRDLLSQLDHPAICVKKGCGAMGADVVLVIYKKCNNNSAEIKNQIEKLDLLVVATEKDLSPGLQISAHSYTNNKEIQI